MSTPNLQDAAKALLDALSAQDERSAEDLGTILADEKAVARARLDLRAALSAPQPAADERVAEHMRLVSNQPGEYVTCSPGHLAAVESSARALLAAGREDAEIAAMYRWFRLNREVRATDELEARQVSDELADADKALEQQRETHELKCWPPYFGAVLCGDKAFELRKADRAFAVGDTLRLREWDPSKKDYTGRYCRRVVTYVTSFPDALQCGYVALGISDTGLGQEKQDAAKALAFRMLVRHWNEFGPEHGFGELMDRLQGSNPTTQPPEGR